MKAKDLFIFNLITLEVLVPGYVDHCFNTSGVEGREYSVMGRCGTVNSLPRSWSVEGRTEPESQHPLQ